MARYYRLVFIIILFGTVTSCSNYKKLYKGSAKQEELATINIINEDRWSVSTLLKVTEGKQEDLYSYGRYPSSNTPSEGKPLKALPGTYSIKSLPYAVKLYHGKISQSGITSFKRVDAS